MAIGDPASLQLLIAWRGNKWLLLRDTVQVGAYAYRAHAMARARTLAVEAAAEGLDGYLLVREQDGRWDEHPCPKAARDG